MPTDGPVGAKKKELYTPLLPPTPVQGLLNASDEKKEDASGGAASHVVPTTGGAHVR